MHDLVIRGGSVVDGSGAPPRLADLAIDGDKIVAVGGEVGPGHRTLDAAGLVGGERGHGASLARIIHHAVGCDRRGANESVGRCGLVSC